MTTDEFGKFWTLMRELFSASSRLKSENTKLVWRIALEPYALDDVTSATMEYARKNKFFPDIADITAKLPAPQKTSHAVVNGVSHEDTAWMLPYLQKLEEAYTTVPKRALALHLVGLRTWPEARESGVTWKEWVVDHDERAKLLPPGWGALLDSGLTYAEAVPVMERNWVDFWDAHGQSNLGVP